jgi:hypothetical protein
MRVAAAFAQNGPKRSGLHAACAEHYPRHLMPSAFVINDVVWAEFRESKEARSIYGFRFALDS